MVNVKEDSLYKKLLQELPEMKRISTSYLQRQHSIGYGRAARIIDQLFLDGYIGEPRGSQPREIFIFPQNKTPTKKPTAPCEACPRIAEENNIQLFKSGKQTGYRTVCEKHQKILARILKSEGIADSCLAKLNLAELL